MKRRYNELVGSQFFSEKRQAELNASIIRDQILEAERIAEARGEARGETKGEMKSIIRSLQVLMNKLNMDIDQAMEFLDYDVETQEKIK